MKKMLFMVVFASMVLSSCEKNETDLRDEYVGEWSADVSGKISMMMDNEPMGDFPMSMEDDFTITKVSDSDDGLNIDGINCTLKGNKLVFEDETSTANLDGVNTNMKIQRTGTAEKGKITITETYDGTWTMMMMMSGTIKGTNVITLTKK